MPLRLKPTYIIDHVTDINLQELKDEGVKGILFDLDNTLMAPNTGVLTEDIDKWLQEVSIDFKIAVLSNNTDLKYMEEVSEIFHCPVYASAKKPSRKIAIKALKELELLPSQVAMVGDRPLTDIWVGQRLGMITILVDPLIKHKEHRIVKCLRKLERIFIKSSNKTFRDNEK